MGFRFGLSGLIWLAQTAALAFLVVSCITAPVVSDLGLADADGVQYGVFGYCIQDRGCSPVSASYGPERVFSGTQWAMGQDMRRVLGRILVVAPVAAGLTLLAVVSNFVSQFSGVHRHAGIFVSNLLWTILAFFSSALLCIVVWLLFWPHLTWCAYVLLAAAVIHLFCVPLTFLAHSQVCQDSDDESLHGALSSQKLMKREDDYANSFNMNELHKTAIDSDVKQPGYYKVAPVTTGDVTDSTKTDYTDIYGSQQAPPPQPYLRSTPQNRNSYVATEPQTTSAGGNGEESGKWEQPTLAPYPMTGGFSAQGYNRPSGPPIPPYPSTGSTKDRTANYDRERHDARSGMGPTGDPSYYPAGMEGVQQPYSAINDASKNGIPAGSTGDHAKNKLPYATSTTARNADPSASGVRGPYAEGLPTASSSNYEVTQLSSGRITARPAQSPAYPSSAGEPVKQQPYPRQSRNLDYPNQQDFDDEEFVRQNTVDPEERPPIEEDDGIKDDDSDFTSVSQRGINPNYYTIAGKQAPYPQTFSAPLPHNQAIYPDQPYAGPPPPDAYQTSNSLGMSRQGAHQQYVSQGYTPQPQGYQASGYYSAPSTSQPRAPDTSDMLLQNNPDFMIGGAASNKAARFGGPGQRVQQSAGSTTAPATLYKPAYKKRMQKSKGMVAASLSRDSPYGGR
ncbi:AEL027Wp [Eremothecium gossypii ATCC 10895]|uniref:AEL027Wp n=1 Tax=Eremothecium gossypii (strain ATCC 10895 / CBS 109.51 / FGSC 9923 / NRRL Y-1056) TaxID=284811 RepID=Q757N9_EREGS|nr:AEL027Wp [Eremothecium gossypii ATCC 10895]AAS52658.2 AEL027Wp [Eremothecium gossypii ATCC 10895]